MSAQQTSGETFVLTPWRGTEKTSRVKASPWHYCIGDPGLRGGSRCCRIDHPKILLPSQCGDIQILFAKAHGGSGVGGDRGRWQRGALHCGRGVRRGATRINLQLGRSHTDWTGVHYRRIVRYKGLQLTIIYRRPF